MGDVWGIGRQWARFLEENGIATALDLTSQPDSWIRRHLNVIGLRTATELRGTTCIPLDLAPSPRKGLVVSRMFGKKLTDFEPVKEALVAYVTRAAEELRRDLLLARYMQVFIRNSPFDRREPYFSNATGFQLAHPTSDTAELIRHACHALSQIFRPGIHYAKCGVMLTELIAAGTEQRDMFDTRDEERSLKLMTALDAINRRMGRNTVFYAGSGIKRDWAAFANMKTQAFSTDWKHLMEIRHI